MTDVAPPVLLTTREVEELLGVSHSSVRTYRLLHGHPMPSFLDEAGRRMFDRDKVLEWNQDRIRRARDARMRTDPVPANHDANGLECTEGCIMPNEHDDECLTEDEIEDRKLKARDYSAWSRT